MVRTFLLRRNREPMDCTKLMPCSLCFSRTQQVWCKYRTVVSLLRRHREPMDCIKLMLCMQFVLHTHAKLVVLLLRRNREPMDCSK